MKNKFISLFITAIFLLSFTVVNLIAQDIVDVPPLDGDNKPNLVKTIMGDTTTAGARNNPDRIYRLEREGVYVMEATMFVDFSLHLIAAADNSKRPPMIVRGKNAEAKNINPMINFTGNGTKPSFSNIIFQGVDLDRKYSSEWFSGHAYKADDMSVTYDSCIFNAFTGGAISNTGKNNSLYIRDTKWRNGVAENHQFIGQQFVNFGPLDTLVFTNNTYFNNNSFLLFLENNLANYVVIEHNTFFTAIIDLFRMRDLVNANFRSNLFYATHAYGQSPTEKSAGWFDADEQVISLFSLDTVGVDLMTAAGLSESDRIVNATNNSYFFPQQIHDYWDSYDTVSGTIWMHDRTLGMFNDNTNYPYLYDTENVEKNPEFTNVDMDLWVVGAVADFCRNFRDGVARTNRNYDAQTNSGEIFLLQWPLPETLEYSNAEMLVAGHDGLPVGDLNWFPAQRANYVEDEIVAHSALAPIENKQITVQTGLFTASWKVTPTHSPMDGVTGLAKGEVGTFGDMGVLVRMNSTGKVDARNGGAYEALNELTYEAGKEYTINVSVDVPAQKYSVEVTPAGGSAVVIGTDYGFRTSTPQESLGYMAMIINELQQFGGVPGSRLNPSFLNDDFTLVTDVEKIDSELPTEFAMEQNYPNPFNPTTVINYSVAKVTNVNIEVFNSLGQKVKTLVTAEQSVGNYSVDWNGTDVNNNKVSTGIYFYKINAGQFVETRKMLLMK